MRRPTRLTRHNADDWAEVLRQEIPKLPLEQARSHIAGALKEVADLARHQEREICAEMIKDVILALVDRYLDISSPYGRQDLAEAMLELKAKVDGRGD